MVEIRYVKINGLYSYGSEKNRINFGKRTVVVGVNDSGKSSIFKALKFFLKCLTERGSTSLRPWDQQDTHEMTVGLSLNDEERRYTAEILSVINRRDGSRSKLAPDKVVGWLAPRLGRMDLTISWHDSPIQPVHDHVEYSLCLDGLGATIRSVGYSGDVWARLPSDSELTRELLYYTIESMLENDPMAERLARGGHVCLFPPIKELDAGSSSDGRSRIELVERMSGHMIQQLQQFFFVMFGRMLERRFAFVSEQRSFQKSNDLERLPLKSDGSNLQSHLLWLQSGDKNDQCALSAIHSTFANVLKQQSLSFTVSVTEKKVSDKSELDEPKEKIYPGRAVVRFVRTSDQGQRLLDFMSVGAGVRETLFLLTMCFGRRNGVVLLDEPAANLHPTQIRRLMRKIMSTGDQSAKSGQVALITHSPTLASLELLSRANEIVRVNRREYSLVAQPSGEDREWIEENLPTFHHLKSDVFFAGGVVLVEGRSDKFFLEAILDRSPDQSDDIAVVDAGASPRLRPQVKSLDQSGDIAVVDAGGKESFKKFRDLLGIFEIPYVILADNDNDDRDLFDPDEVLKVDAKVVPNTEDGTGKTVCLLGKKLEGFLSDLEPELYAELEKKHKPKPERAYHFARRFFAEDLSDRNTKILKFLTGWISKNLESAEQHGDPPSSPKSLPAGSARGAA